MYFRASKLILLQTWSLSQGKMWKHFFLKLVGCRGSKVANPFVSLTFAKTDVCWSFFSSPFRGIFSLCLGYRTTIYTNCFWLASEAMLCVVVDGKTGDIIGLHKSELPIFSVGMEGWSLQIDDFFSTFFWVCLEDLLSGAFKKAAFAPFFWKILVSYIPSSKSGDVLKWPKIKFQKRDEWPLETTQFLDPPICMTNLGDHMLHFISLLPYTYNPCEQPLEGLQDFSTQHL